MFEKLKNIKFSLRKKKKNEGDAPADDLFSSSEDDNFFSEPTFGEDDGSADDLFGDTGMEDGSTTDLASDLPEDNSFKEKGGSSPAKGGSSAKRTFLLFILLIIFSAYAAYTYVLPANYPEIKKEVDATVEELIAQATQLISGEETPETAPPPTRVAIQKPPKKAMPKPPAKTEEQAAREAAAPADKEVKKAMPAKAQEAVKKEVVEPKAEVKQVAQTPAPEKPKQEVRSEPKKEPAPAVRIEPEKKPVAAVKPKSAAGKRPSQKKVDFIKAKLPVSKKGYYIQAGAFIFKDNLNIPRKKIESLGFRPIVKTGTKLISMNRLLVGEWSDFLIAEDIAAKLRRKGFSAELTSKEERFCVLIGSYYYRHKAEKKKKALKSKGFDSRIEKKPLRMNINHLLLGPYATPEEAAEVKEALDKKGLKTVIIKTK